LNPAIRNYYASRVTGLLDHTHMWAGARRAVLLLGFSYMIPLMCLSIRDAEAIEYFFSLPTPYKVSHFRICFRFHISVPCFMKKASASGSLKTQMLPSSLPASFVRVLPLPQKFNRFLFPHLCFQLTSISFVKTSQLSLTVLCRVNTCRFDNQVPKEKLL